MSFFTAETYCKQTKARAGKLFTDHGIINTPVFMPVGTQGTVKAIEQKILREIGYNLILGNTYHLYLRPGMDVMEHFSGLHNFMKWDGAILTDSGGYQVFSLQDLRKLSEDGVEFRSHIDGSKHFFSPENVVGIQRIIGSDIIMPLDECTSFPSDYSTTKKSMELTLRWAKRASEEFKKTENLYCKKQFLFAIGQGGMYDDLRKHCLDELIEMDFDSYAIGGLSVGEPVENMYEITDLSTDILPKDKARYLMGVGTPENVLESIALGIDMFDCVLPTRNARNGQIFTSRGKINIRNAKYKFSDEPIDSKVNCYSSNNYSLGYLRHLFISGEILGAMLATMQNLAFYKYLTDMAREKILNGEFRQWKDIILKNINFEDKEVY